MCKKSYIKKKKRITKSKKLIVNSIFWRITKCIAKNTESQILRKAVTSYLLPVEFFVGKNHYVSIRNYAHLILQKSRIIIFFRPLRLNENARKIYKGKQLNFEINTFTNIYLSVNLYSFM